ncbi:MAG: helix-turn-helix domain-containing protein, partial [Alteromonas sp.]|nr:helix-turn-helix domain-containing protein [Alteromonas sp.]
MGGRRGQLTTFSDRQYYVSLVDEAVSSGARKHKACDIIGLSLRTLQRWRDADGIRADKRPEAVRPTPANKLTEVEQQAILDICNEERFASLPPSQIVPMLADEGVYLGSESSFYRI